MRFFLFLFSSFFLITSFGCKEITGDNGPAERITGSYKGNTVETRPGPPIEEELDVTSKAEIQRTSDRNITIKLTRCRPFLGEEEIGLDGIIDENDESKFIIVGETFSTLTSKEGSRYRVNIFDGTGEIFSTQSLRLRFLEEYTLLEPGPMDSSPFGDFTSSSLFESDQVNTGSYTCR